jgi:putative nucleotidyltransferase with HDIG domain
MNSFPDTEELNSAKLALTEDPQSLVKLKPLPVVAMKVSEACGNANVDIRELTKLVESDPAIAAKILSVVNSAIYGHMRDVSSIHQALVVLGRRNIVQLAISIATNTVFAANDETSEFKRSIFEHSLAVASVAGSLVRHDSLDVDPGTAFLAGVLHDVGKLILLDAAPQTYSSFTDQNHLEVSTIQAEQELFGTDHAALGNIFAETWNLSIQIQHAISQHHSPSRPDADYPLTKTIQLANQLVKAWAIGQAEPTDVCEATATWLNNRDDKSQEMIRANAAESFEETKALLSS